MINKRVPVIPVPPKVIAGMVDRLLLKDPDERYHDVSELISNQP